MSKSVRTALLGVLCATTTLGAIPPEALAGPMSVAPAGTVSLSAPVENVYYYRRHYRPVYHLGYYRPRTYYVRRVYYYPRRVYYYGYPYGYYPAYYSYDPGGAVFAGAALGLMGASIAIGAGPRWGYWGWGGPGWWWW
jgi:hypothetical protein